MRLLNNQNDKNTRRGAERTGWAKTKPTMRTLADQEKETEDAETLVQSFAHPSFEEQEKKKKSWTKHTEDEEEDREEEK